MNTLASIFSSPMMRITNKSKGTDVLVPMRILKTRLTFPSRTARHMREDGSTMVDQRVLMPTGIDIEMIAPTLDVLQQANETFLDRSSVFTVQTRGIIIEDLRVDYEGIEQTARNISSTPLKYSFKQMLYQGNNKAVSFQAADSSVIDRGLAVVNNAKETVLGIADKVKNITSIF